MVPRQNPAYNLEDFLEDCRDASRAYVSKGAQETAKRDFQLQTQKAIREFIADGGLEKPIHANTAPWQNAPDGESQVLVDSYNFYSGPECGYIAFFRRNSSARWIIKSFKANKQHDQRNLVFAEVLKDFKLGEGKDGG